MGVTAQAAEARIAKERAAIKSVIEGYVDKKKGMRPKFARVYAKLTQDTRKNGARAASRGGYRRGGGVQDLHHAGF